MLTSLTGRRGRSRLCACASPLALSLLFAAGPARAILMSGPPLDPELSGFLSIKTAGKTCTGVMVADDAFITSKRCFADAEMMHPEMVGWVMGSQDSFDNPIKQLSEEFSGLVIGRLERAVLVNAPGKPPQRWPLYRAPIERLDQAQLDCFSYGQIANDGRPLYGATLGRGRYSVAARDGTRLWVNGNRLNRSDVGGACFDLARPNEIAAIIVDVDDIQAIPLPVPWSGGSNRREWASRFLTKFELVAQHSGRCLTVPAPHPLVPTQLEQFTCLTRDDQRFRAVPLGGGSYEIRAVHSDKCLSVLGRSRDDLAPVIENTCAGDLGDPLDLPSALLPDQVWRFEYAGDNHVQVVNDFSGKCLDVRGGDRRDGATIIQFRCDRAAGNQRWQMTAVAFGEDAHALVAGGASCADVYGGLTTTGADIGLFGCHGGTNQQWQLAAIPPHFMAAMSAHTDFNMVMAGVSARVVQLPWTAAQYEQWRFDWRPGGYALRSRTDESLCIAVGTDGLLVERRCADTSRGYPLGGQSWRVQ